MQAVNMQAFRDKEVSGTKVRRSTWKQVAILLFSPALLGFAAGVFSK
jgi:hypothetical protein